MEHSRDPEGPKRRPRLTTGIPGFDEVVGGGLFSNGVYIIQGAPGSGKTVLASQLCFHVAAQGRRAVYVTLLSELHASLITNLEEFTFFDPGAVSRGVLFLGAYRAAEQGGLAELAELLRGIVAQHTPALVVIDGFRVVEQAPTTLVEINRFVQNLQVLASLTGSTMLLLNAANAGESSPEQASADGLIELEEQLMDTRSLRSLVVRKMRGSSHLHGRHIFRITNAGLRIFPRLESHGPAVGPRWPEARLSWGIARVDAALDGGVEVGSTTMLLGASGTGKTTLGLHFLAEGLRRREPALHFGFFERPDALYKQAERLGLQLHHGDGLLRMEWEPPVEQFLDELGHRLITCVREHGSKRLFIDGLVGFTSSSLYPQRLGRFFTALSHELCALGATTIITEETRQLLVQDVSVPVPGVSAIWENIVYLRRLARDAEMRWAMLVLKTRGHRHERGLLPFEIAEGRGVVFGERLADIEGSAVRDEGRDARG